MMKTTDDAGLDFGFTLENTAQRYLMNFIGGVIGGPLFELHGEFDAFARGIRNKTTTIDPNNANQELVRLISMGQEKDLLDEVEV